MEDIETPANNTEGEGTTPIDQPTIEPTTEAINSPVSEDINPATKAPKTVPYEKFAETRRELRELKNLVNQRLPQPASQPGRELDSFIDENGNVDINGYTQMLLSKIPSADQIVETLERKQSVRDLQRKEEDELFSAYPELKNDPTRLKAVRALKNQSLLENEYISEKEAAEQLFEITGKIATEVRKTATETHRVQENIAPAPATGKVNTAAIEEAQLKEAMNSDDPVVRQQARLKWLQNRNK